MEKSRITNSAIGEASEIFAQRLSKYPIEEQLAVGIIGPNLINGCYWGFTNDRNSEIKRAMRNFEASKSCSLLKVRGGYIVSMSFDRIIALLRKETQGLVGLMTAEDLEKASEHRKNSIVLLNNLMAKKHYRGRIGIFCLNDSPRIVVDGKQYPAFSVSLNDLISICIRNGYNLKPGNRVLSPKEATSGSAKIIENLQLAPSGNALFIDIV